MQRTIGSYILKKECSIVLEYADADVVRPVVGLGHDHAPSACLWHRYEAHRLL